MIKRYILPIQLIALASLFWLGLVHAAPAPTKKNKAKKPSGNLCDPVVLRQQLSKLSSQIRKLKQQARTDRNACKQQLQDQRKQWKKQLQALRKQLSSAGKINGKEYSKMFGTPRGGKPFPYSISNNGYRSMALNIKVKSLWKLSFRLGTIYQWKTHSAGTGNYFGLYVDGKKKDQWVAGYQFYSGKTHVIFGSGYIVLGPGKYTVKLKQLLYGSTSFTSYAPMQLQARMIAHVTQ